MFSFTDKIKIATTILCLGVAFPVFAWAGASKEEEATMQEVRQETQEALRAIKTYSLEQRDEAVQRVESVLQD